MRYQSTRRARLRLDPLEPREVPAGLIVSYAPGPDVLPRELGHFTPEGTLATSYPVPDYPATGDSGIHDLVASNGGSWLTFNGTFNPGLSVFTPGDGWRHGSLPGLSSVNNMSYGGLTTIDRWAFLPDMETGGSGAAKGIVRFELDSLTGTRFFTDDEYTDLN